MYSKEDLIPLSVPLVISSGH